jgi:hypothetical protein
MAGIAFYFSVTRLQPAQPVVNFANPGFWTTPSDSTSTDSALFVHVPRTTLLTER